jgi:hypothetical protein
MEYKELEKHLSEEERQKPYSIRDLGLRGRLVT